MNGKGGKITKKKEDKREGEKSGALLEGNRVQKSRRAKAGPVGEFSTIPSLQI